MAKVLEMPKLSPTMQEGVLSIWHKREGDALSVDDLLAEVETDKATMEFRSFDAGIVRKLLVAPGTQVMLGQPVAIVGSASEDITALLARVGAQATAKPPNTPLDVAPNTPPERAAIPPQAQATPSPDDTIPPPAVRNPPVANILDRTAHWPEIAAGPRRSLEAGREAPLSSIGGDRVLASPYVRKMARDLGIKLQGAVGSGPGGRVVVADLDNLRARLPASPLVQVPPAPTTAVLNSRGDPDELRPLSPMRKTIARRLVESKTTIPHFYLSVDVDAEPLARLREQINADLAASPSSEKGVSDAGVKVSYNDFLIKACAIALAHVPECNASYTPDAIRVHKRVDISVAVAIPDGLVTPVVRDAARKSLVSIAVEMRELAARARARKLAPEEMQDGTFSITNLGMFGIDAFAAVINPPEGAILAVGAVRDVPVVAGGQLAAGKRLHLTLSCDHRVIDGAVGAAFLSELRHLVEHPMRTLAG